ncbi:30S ribosomal protein S5 alanine N-acetyltransferase [Rhodoblastus sphagnicola]|uniref:30S ribosomal protein S5 alanine N-acetyltransferase n=2 Tax=Rhodoblastus sphagnicola TaxID=333368 RepID=A0A2S6NBN2_9HYPH|nr:GNAT family N-acetyltransferase [Rhodoblastus sphagnicola]PPQ32025.1 30S ribosomal protein S5 alanine N-acetyltransferase [Rhodoblastus sphagnicola]
MSFFTLSRRKPAEQVIPGEGVYLRPAMNRDFECWRDLRADSRAFLKPWEPRWPADDLSRAGFRRRLLRQDRDRQDDQAYSFLLFREQDHALLGGLTLGNIRRGVAQCATLGYWMGEAFAGQGYMSKGVHAALRHAFTDLRLHRVEAACAPHNERSRRLLERLGFQHEGFARAYLLIDSAWQDHLLFGLLESDFLGSAPPDR